jgi:putative RecB family exonuclease
MSDRPLIPVSPTKLDVWQQCAFRFRLRYVDKVPADGSWAHLSLGNAVHAALRDWFDVEGRSPATGAELVGQHWISDGFRDDAQSDHWHRVAAGWVGAYVEQHATDAPYSRERTLGTLAEHVTISGRIDRLDERGEELVVVDYKTGARVPSADDAKVSRALAIYALVVQRSLKRPAYCVQLHHVPSGVVVEHRHDDASLARQLSRVDAMGRDIAAALATDDPAAFPTAPGPLCGWCDVRAHCPDSGAAPAQPRWAGLPDGPSIPDTFPI